LFSEGDLVCLGLPIIEDLIVVDLVDLVVDIFIYMYFSLDLYII